MNVSVICDELVIEKVSPSREEAVSGISLSHSLLDLPLQRSLSLTLSNNFPVFSLTLETLVLVLVIHDPFIFLKY